jgi:hypothetical protein
MRGTRIVRLYYNTNGYTFYRRENRKIAADILRQRASMKRQAIEHRRLQHRKIAA